MNVSITTNYSNKLLIINSITKTIKINTYVYLLFFAEAVNLIINNDIYTLIINTFVY